MKKNTIYTSTENETDDVFMFRYNAMHANFMNENAVVFFSLKQSE